VPPPHCTSRLNAAAKGLFASGNFAACLLVDVIQKSLLSGTNETCKAPNVTGFGGQRPLAFVSQAGARCIKGRRQEQRGQELQSHRIPPSRYSPQSESGTLASTLPPPLPGVPAPVPLQPVAPLPGAFTAAELQALLPLEAATYSWLFQAIRNL
jgi:hypothetical protein